MKEIKLLYKSILKSMVSRYSVYAFNLLSMMILARVFTPQTFGVIAAALVFYTFFQIMTEAGIGPAIINLKCLKTRERNGIFGLTFLIGLCLGLILYSCSSLIEKLYNIEDLQFVIPFISISVVVFALTILPTGFHLREQNFYYIALSGIVAEILSTIIAIISSFYLEPVYALSIKYLVSAVVVFIIQMYFCNKTEFGRPNLGIHFVAIKPLLSFSLYQFGFNFINFFSRNLDNILVGKYLGAASLGVYDKAYQLMKYPLMMLTFSMTPAIQPVIRKNANDKIKVEIIHRDFTLKLSLLGTLIGSLIYFLSDFIVLVMLGPQWDSVGRVIQVLSLSIPIQVVLSTSGSFFQAMNRPKILFFSGICSAFTMVLAIACGISQGDLVKLSWYIVLAMNINFFQAYILLYKYVFDYPVTVFLYRMLPLFFVQAILLIIDFFSFYLPSGI